MYKMTFEGDIGFRNPPHSKQCWWMLLGDHVTSPVVSCRSGLVELALLSVCSLRSFHCMSARALSLSPPSQPFFFYTPPEQQRRAGIQCGRNSGLCLTNPGGSHCGLCEGKLVFIYLFITICLPQRCRQQQQLQQRCVALLLPPAAARIPDPEPSWSAGRPSTSGHGTPTCPTSAKALMGWFGKFHMFPFKTFRFLSILLGSVHSISAVPVISSGPYTRILNSTAGCSATLHCCRTAFPLVY